MKKSFIALVIATSLSTGCATIFDGASKPVSIQTDPAGAQFTITNREGRVISSGLTPQQINLDNGAGYFKKAEYTIKVTKPGYEDTTANLTPDLAGWYWGNLIFGGLIGMVIVDPSTGAMYKLPDETTIPMRKKEEAEVASVSAISSSNGQPTSQTYGKWQYQAEELARTSSCSKPSFTETGPGVELYTANCNEAPISIRCEFGHCAVQ